MGKNCGGSRVTDGGNAQKDLTEGGCMEVKHGLGYQNYEDMMANHIER